MESLNDVLQGIARHISQGEHGAIMQFVATAYFYADEEEKKDLRPFWQNLIEKYLLKNHVVVQEAESQ